MGLGFGLGVVLLCCVGVVVYSGGEERNGEINGVCVWILWREVVC